MVAVCWTISGFIGEHQVKTKSGYQADSPVRQLCSLYNRKQTCWMDENGMTTLRLVRHKW